MMPRSESPFISYLQNWFVVYFASASRMKDARVYMGLGSSQPHSVPLIQTETYVVPVADIRRASS